MKAADIWSGHYYAYVAYPTRGSLPMKAIRVRALRLFKEREFGNEKMTTKVEVERVDEDGNVISDRAPFTTTSRNLVDFWDDYVDERDHVLEERKQRQERAEREAEERKQRAEAEKRHILRKLAELGIPEEAVYRIDSYVVQLNRTWLLREAHVRSQN